MDYADWIEYLDARVILGACILFAVFGLCDIAAKFRDRSHRTWGMQFYRSLTIAFVVALASQLQKAVESSTSDTIAFIYIVVFILVAGILLAAWLLDMAAGLTRLLSKTWIKSLDFLYLPMAVFGLFRLAMSIKVNTAGISADAFGSRFDVVALTWMSFGLSIRLAKAIIEVFFDDLLSGVDKKCPCRDDSAIKESKPGGIQELQTSQDR